MSGDELLIIAHVPEAEFMCFLDAFILAKQRDLEAAEQLAADIGAGESERVPEAQLAA